MDLGEAISETNAKCDYEKIHLLIESTYKNILKNFNPGVKQLIILGKALQKTIHNVGTSSKAYIECFYDLAQSAEACKGSTHDLGTALLQLADSQNEINQQLLDSIKVFHAELLIPLKAKQENEFRHTQVLYDKYLSGQKTFTNQLRKAENVMEKHRNKKSKPKPGINQKEIQRKWQVKESRRRLEEYLRKNLRLALLEERKRYCYFFNRLLCTVEDKAAKHHKAEELLTEGLRSWPGLCKSPHILPASSEQIIQDFGFSDDSCEGDDEPNVTDRTASLNRDMRNMGSKERFSWSRGKTYEGGIGLRNDDGTGKLLTQSAAPTPTPIDGQLNQSVDSKEEINEPEPEAEQKNEDAEAAAATSSGGYFLSVVHPYTGANENQLSLEANDVIRVIDDVHNGWQYGQNSRTKKEGWFPVSFTDFNAADLKLAQQLKSNCGQYTPPPRNPCLVRKTWYSETAYDRQLRSSASSDGDSAEANPSSKGTTIGTRPMSSYCPTVYLETDQSTVRSKPPPCRPGWYRYLETIPEYVPPPEQFRDKVENESVASTSVTVVSRETIQLPVSGEQTTADDRKQTNINSVDSQLLQVTVKQSPVLQSEFKGAAYTAPALPPPPPPPPRPSPSPPMPPSYSHLQHNRQDAESAHVTLVVPDGSARSTSPDETSELAAYSSSPLLPSSYPLPPPRPPPPLLGTYQPVRVDHYQRPRLKTASSQDSAKIT